MLFTTVSKLSSALFYGALLSTYIASLTGASAVHVSEDPDVLGGFGVLGK
jgi:hypothetical protein